MEKVSREVQNFYCASLIYWGQISLKCFCSFMNISISSWLALFPPPSLAPTCLKFTDVPSFVPLNGNRIHFLNVRHRSLSSVNNNYFHCKWNKCGLDLDNLSFFFPVLISLIHYRPLGITEIILWLCYTRTGNFQIHEFDWLKSILKAV